MMTSLLTFFLITSAFFFLPNADPYSTQEMFIQYSAIAALGLSFIIEPVRKISNLWFGILFLYAFANTIIGSFNPTSRMALINVFLGVYLIKFLAERIDFNFRKIG